jgi:hypothetical protein
VTRHSTIHQKFLYLTAAFCLGCNGIAPPSTPSSEQLTAGLAAASKVFSGTVVDVAGQPIAQAQVTINGIARLTNTSGRYFVSIAEAKLGYRLDVRKNGYAPVTEFRLAGALDLVHTLRSGFTVGINPAIPNTIVDATSGIRVNVPANSLRSNGGAPVGSVRFSIIAQNSQTMPGDFTARNARGETVALISVGAATFQAVDGAGNTLGLVPGAALDVAIPVPASAGASMPDCVLKGTCRAAIWRFDPASALWVENPVSNPRFGNGATLFTVRGPVSENERIDPADGLGTWNADVEFVNPACTVVEFTSMPLECFSPPGVVPEPGIEVAFTQALAGGGTKSKTAAVLSSAAFLLLYNLRPNVAVDLSFTFPPGAPASCAKYLVIDSTPPPNPGFPVYSSSGGVTQLDTGAPWGGTGYPTNSGGMPVTFADVAAGDYPCNSYVSVRSVP